MVLETQPVPFVQWIGSAISFFVIAALLLGLVALVVGYLIAAFRLGPLAGGDLTLQVVKSAARDLLALSPRRIFALARLAIQESLRRRVLAVFGVFLLVLLFAGWFLDTSSNDPAKLYLSFVLTTTTYLVLLMALFLSAFSLPTDIKNRTIHTVVTKPVRPGEIVLGRILGFTLIGTVLLAVMGLFSYVFVVRLVNHTHEIEEKNGQLTGRTTLVQGHRHAVNISPDDTEIKTESNQRHWHKVTSRKDSDGKISYEVGPPEGIFLARVPVYGKLSFINREGKPTNRGISVGNEWRYRSYIDGATPAAAIWRFTGLTPEQFPDGLPFEMTIRVFRSWKGEIEQGIAGTLQLRNPRKNVSSEFMAFTARDPYIAQIEFDRDLIDPKGKTIDLFDDLVDDGELEVVLQCSESGQYFGVAQPDVYLRAYDRSFTINYLKTFVAIWLQMVLVTSFGVMFSTFLSGAVAMMATLVVILLGFKTQFILDVAAGVIQGGGPLESLIRLLTQQNVTGKMEPGLTTDVVQYFDKILMFFMTVVANLIPNFSLFSSVDYLAYGFDVPLDLVFVQFVRGMAYVAVVFVVGYFFLKTREVAR